MKDVLLVGEAMVLFSAETTGSLAEVTEFKKSVAGAELNVGIGLSRLDHQVAYLTKLSRDDFGYYIHQTLAQEKLLSDYLYYDEHKPTGVMFKNKVNQGDPKTLYVRKNSAASALTLTDIQAIDFSQFKVMHMTGILPALSQNMSQVSLELMKQAKKAGCYITFDPNLRPALWPSEELMIQQMNELASYADLILPGISEGEILTGHLDHEAIADFYLARGVKTVVVKLGDEGAVVKEVGQSQGQLVPGFKVTEVVDTVGAGDGFAVGIIHGYLSGLPIEKAVENANAIGALQVQDSSDNQALPTRQELADFKASFGR